MLVTIISTKTWVNYELCITRPIVTSWLERSPCFRYDMLEAGLALLDESDWVILRSRNQLKLESRNIFNSVGKMFQYFKGLELDEKSDLIPFVNQRNKSNKPSRT